MAPTDTARCATHPEVAAVDTCTRCGRFVCGECADVGPDDATVCTSCAQRVAPEPVPRGATRALVLGLLGFTWTIGMPNLLTAMGLPRGALVGPISLMALGFALGAVVSGLMNLKAGGVRARTGLVLGAVQVLFFIAVGVNRLSQS